MELVTSINRTKYEVFRWRYQLSIPRKLGLALGMAALVGLITGGFPGFPKVFIALFLSVVTGGLVAAVLLILGIRSRRQPIPFGPFLAIGTMAVVVWGTEIQYWYQQIIA